MSNIQELKTGEVAAVVGGINAVSAYAIPAMPKGLSVPTNVGVNTAKR